MVLSVNIKGMKFTEHFYRHRVRYGHYRYCVQKHYAKLRFSGKRTLGSCNAKQLSKGFRVFFISLQTLSRAN